MKKYLIAASVLAITAVSSANAADIIRPQPVTPIYTAPVFSWTGGYIGAQLGWAWADTNVKTDAFDARKFSPDPDGFIGGVYLGYNYQLSSNLIIGLETDFAWTSIDGKKGHDLYTTAGALDGYASAKLKQEWEGATRVRLGYAADRWMPYLAGGVAYSKIKTTIGGENTAGVALQSVSGSDTFVGWTAGAGVDYAVTDNLLLRLEYRYTDFGNESYKFADGVSKFKTDYKTNDVRVGVAYKF